MLKYLRHLDSRGFSPNTLRSYATDLRLYLEFLEQAEVAYEQVTLDAMADFVLWLKNPYRSTQLFPQQPVEQARSNRTVNHVLGTVFGWYDYMERDDTLSVDISGRTRTLLNARGHTFKGFLHNIAREKQVKSNIFRQKVPKERPKTITIDQVNALLAAARNDRDRVLINLLFKSAFRIGEVLALWVEDIQWGRGLITVRDRGELVNRAEIKSTSSERTIKVSPEMRDQLMRYMAEAHTEDVETNHLFLTLKGPNKGKPLSYHSVIDLFRRLSAKVKFDVWPHLLRHTSLTMLGKAGMRTEAIQKGAGHAHFQTTVEMYIHPEDEELVDEWGKYQERLRVVIDGQEEGHHA